MNADDIRCWDANYRAAAEREREAARKVPPDPARAFAAALELLNFDESCNGSPFGRTDPVSEREDAEVRAAWEKLRARWPRGG